MSPERAAKLERLLELQLALRDRVETQRTSSVMAELGQLLEEFKPSKPPHVTFVETQPLLRAVKFFLSEFADSADKGYEMLPALEARLAALPPTSQAQREAARYLVREDAGIKVDDDACLSAANGGVWVQAWIWLED